MPCPGSSRSSAKSTRRSSRSGPPKPPRTRTAMAAAPMARTLRYVCRCFPLEPDWRQSMVTTATKPDISEVVRRGTKIYEAAIKPLLGAEDIGKPLIIETTTGEYEILPDDSVV